MRQARVRRRAIPQLQAALETGEITLYRAGEIAKLPVHEQAIAVAQWANRSRRRTEGQAIAAQVIRAELTRASSADSKIDLGGVLSAIRAAIGCTTGGDRRYGLPYGKAIERRTIARAR
jgi:hypothetical protein